MNNGFIKLFRCIEDSFFWNDSQAVHLWIQLLLSANHKDKEMLLSGEKVIIKSGHFVCSRNTLSLKTGINESKIQRILKVFESEQMIEQQMNSKYRMISISNWNKYQGSEQVNEQQVNSKRTADEQQMNTNNNDKNEKNDKNKEKDTIVSKKKDKPSGLLPVYFQFMILGLTPDKAILKAEKFYSHYQSNGWKVSKNPMKDWKAATSGTWCDFTKAVGYQKHHLQCIVEELEKQYGDRDEYDQFDFAKLKHSNPQLFNDPEMFNDTWNKYLEGMNDR